MSVSKAEKENVGDQIQAGKNGDKIENQQRSSMQMQIWVGGISQDWKQTNTGN